jgi:flagellar basal-body rod modification protein FlgD
MANTLGSINGSSPTYTDTGAAKSATGTTQVTKNMFLQLLVAQIKNQDPTNPSDGVQFLTQLAQFQQLENGLNMAEDVSAIRSDLEQSTSTTPATN